jgi:hypothetical protein
MEVVLRAAFSHIFKKDEILIAVYFITHLNGGKATLVDIVPDLLAHTGTNCLLANFDEASLFPELSGVPSALRACICSGLKVFFTVSGSFEPSLMTAPSDAGMISVNIFLPPLTIHQCENSLSHLNLLPAKRCPFLKHLLWLAGGIPRYLAMLIEACAGMCSDKYMETDVFFMKSDFPPIKDCWGTLDGRNGIHRKTISASDIEIYCAVSMLEGAVSLISLCVSGRVFRICEDSDGCTVDV